MTDGDAPAPVLVVEDDADVRDTIVEVLNDAGFSAVGAANGAEAVDYLRGEGHPLPCLILLDLMMPVMDGFQFRQEQLRSPAWASIPVVVVTADGRKEKAASLGAAGYLRKPVELHDLYAVVERHCRRRAGAAGR